MLVLGVLGFTSCDNEEPVITLSVDKATASPGEIINIQYAAEDNKKIENYWLYVTVNSPDSVWMDGFDILKVNPHKSGENVTIATYQFEIPLVGQNGDSVLAGSYLNIVGGALDRRANQGSLDRFVFIQ